MEKFLSSLQAFWNAIPAVSHKAYVDFIQYYTEYSNVVTVLIFMAFFIMLTSFIIKKYPYSSFAVGFDLLYEKMYLFFEDILGAEEKDWIKKFIVSLFFILLIANITGVLIEIIAVGFGLDDNKQLALEHYASIPSGEINFNIALAIISVVIIILEQFKALGFWKALYQYFPIFGQGYIPYERGNLNPIIDWPLFILIKFFDIVISMFLGVLEIIGHLAKVISLAFRLFGNIMSGGLLLAMLVSATAAATGAITGGNFPFPAVAPILIHLQGTLVALIQAVVFPLLVAIFIKVSKTH